MSWPAGKGLDTKTEYPIKFHDHSSNDVSVALDTSRKRIYLNNVWGALVVER